MATALYRAGLRSMQLRLVTTFVVGLLVVGCERFAPEAAVAFACPGGRCACRWETDHSIYIAKGWRDHEMVVRHEMRHDLIGHAGHPDPRLGAPCALTWATWAGSRAGIRDSMADRVPVCID